MSEWKTYTLGKDVVTKLGDGLHGTPIYDDNGEYHFINGSNLVEGKIVINSNTKKVTEEEFVKYKKDLSDKTILLGINGTIGNVALYNNEMCILGKSAAYLNINDDFDKSFVRYVLTNDHFQNYIKNNASGTTIKNVGLGLLREYEFSAPVDKAEQQQIAQILTSLDDKIELNIQMNQTLEATAQALFKEWFVNFNFPNFDGELENGLPIGWRMGTVKEMYKTSSGGTPSRAKEDYYENGTVNWVKSKELNGSFIFDTEEKITVDAVKNSSAKLIPKYSVLVAMYGATVGEYAITTRDTTCNQAICAVIENGIYPFTYFFEYFKINRNNIISQASGSAQQNISQALIQQLEILVPPVEVVKKYHSVVESMFIKMENNLLQIQSLTQTRDTLLPKLMSGKIEIKN
jgi:type I restriction enzyme, S subunit